MRLATTARDCLRYTLYTPRALGTRRACSRQSPRGLNTVCTSVVRKLDPMRARIRYQLIFHERGPWATCSDLENSTVDPARGSLLIPSSRFRCYVRSDKSAGNCLVRSLSSCDKLIDAQVERDIVNTKDGINSSAW